jgi:hypothetical protein
LTSGDTPTIKFYPTPGGPNPLGFIYWEVSQRIGWKTINAAAIEQVHSLYGMSAKSNFSFGYNVGAAHMLLTSFLYQKEVELQLVQPKAWQKAVGITAKGKAIKQAVADLAHELYPTAELYGPMGGLRDGRADALMIAHYLTLQE